MEVVDNNQFQSEIIVDSEVRTYLKETAKWAKFLSIIGFIFIGLIVLGGLVTFIFTISNPYSRMSGIRFNIGGFVFLYILMAALYFFPVYYLYNFSSKMLSALQNDDSFDFKLAFKNLKSLYKFVGILTIVFLSIYILFLFFGLMVGMSALTGF